MASQLIVFLFFLVSTLLFFPFPGSAAGYKINEAECYVTSCTAGLQPSETIWASGGKVTPAFWGRDSGDAVQWPVEIYQPMSALKLAVRYSYARQD